MSDKVKEILDKLDPANDNHWTADGQPKLEVIRMLSGDTKVSRDQVITLAPLLTRENARKAKEEAAALVTTETTTPSVTSLTTATTVVSDVPLGTVVPGPALMQTSKEPEVRSNADKFALDPDEETLEEAQERLAYLMNLRDKVAAELLVQQARVDAKVEAEEEDNGEPEHIKNQRCIAASLQGSVRRYEARAAVIAEHGQTRLVKTVQPSPLDQALAQKRK